MSVVVKIYLCAVVIASIASFGAYAIDKVAAVRRRGRIRERTLHLLALAGGWPGAWVAQQLFRHKTRDVSFRMVYWSIVALHLVAIVAWLIF